MPIWTLYTAWALIIATGLLWRLIRGPACVHAWKVVTDRDMGPAVEEAIKLGFNFKEGASGNWWRRVYWAVIACDRCGALKTFKVLHTPEL
jgi:hypothetical protein